MCCGAINSAKFGFAMKEGFQVLEIIGQEIKNESHGFVARKCGL
jgi:hypothetical protein